MIKKLMHEDNWVEGTSALKPIMLQYFSNLFTSEVQAVDPEVLNKIFPKVTPIMNEGLLAPFTPEEVKKAPFCIGDLKARLHAIFYKRF
jgi:hypothetical protein